VQARYRSLIDARDRGGLRPPPRHAAAREIAEIEREMGTPAYTRNATLQARYRELIAARDNLPTLPDNRHGASAEWRRGLPTGLAAEWDTAGSFDQSLERVQMATVTVLAGIGDPHEAQAFVGAFKALPDRIRGAVLREIAGPEPGFVRPANDKEMAAFRMQDGDSEMIDGWGRTARRRVAIFLYRLPRLVTSMSASDRSA
jgi:hypothetical protein